MAEFSSSLPIIQSSVGLLRVEGDLIGETGSTESVSVYLISLGLSTVEGYRPSCQSNKTRRDLEQSVFK